jgi:hypothetical protein
MHEQFPDTMAQQQQKLLMRLEYLFLADVNLN